ncbi:DUF1128 domain-containing protein [Paenibacillaceae bacterium]|nr:DUF1128 domain-containing protein [Paenibacillaceae bacterium]
MRNLDEATQDNVEFMIEAIKSKLKMATAAAMQASHFKVAQYEDIKEVYEVIADKNNFSISEVEALVTELGTLRSK